MTFNDVKTQINIVNSHDKVVELYNKIKPLPVGYILKNTDDWCAAYVSTILYYAGYKKICECSVPRMIQIAKMLKIWKTGIKPKIGDLVIYDWDSIKDGDHVGIIIAINGNSLTVKEGNKNNAIGIRVINYYDSKITGFIVIPYENAEKTKENTKNSYKTVDEIVSAIIAGKFGNGEDRKNNLYNYFQNLVNIKLK